MIMKNKVFYSSDPLNDDFAGNDIDVLGADHDVDLLVFLEAVVDTFIIGIVEADQTVLLHDAVDSGPDLVL